ncbi:uncharacterized protein PpBr36_10886 [Pyricularia pennisetigena]|uniref:uncharacterized protein n=1 Tax=Pyricularia pennisetigena TaxID=1578925 RepID=UPI00114FFC39|nr:uncharacterized protein PpBr36_10886 [Pyricularia pennisetigena]TLS20967.1 hypothetical protein PpBr36_10886 [Pyricularia pennisetigena]
MKPSRTILVLKTVIILALPHMENRRYNDYSEALSSETSPTFPSAFDSSHRTNTSSTLITCDHATSTIGRFLSSTSTYKTPTLSVTTSLADKKQKKARGATFNEGVPTPTTVAVAIMQCTQTARTRRVTSSPSSTPSSSTPVACQAYIVSLTNMARSGTATSSAAATSIMTSCGPAKPTKTTETPHIPTTIPVTLDNSICFMSTVASTGLFTAGSDITTTMFTAHKPTKTCRPIGWGIRWSWMMDNAVTTTTSGDDGRATRTRI